MQGKQTNRKEWSGLVCRKPSETVENVRTLRELLRFKSKRHAFLQAQGCVQVLHVISCLFGKVTASVQVGRFHLLVVR